MWFPDCFFYHIYPLGFCGAPEVNDGSSSHRLQKITEWIPHMRRLGVNALYLGPLFESDSHGYDTRDYGSVDRRLGTNEELRALCRELHAAGIKVVFDGVFNHVGRGFWAFQDVKQKRWDSPYKDWFHIRFEHNNAYNDGFSYDNWEGHDQLVRLNLHNPAVVDHLFAQIRMWHDTFGLDGLRLDVAYLLPDSFLRSLRSFCRELDPEFVLIGEMIHGDYNRLVRPDMLDSSTNYECFKGIHSAFNDRNLFEIGHSLARQFGPEPWTLYKDKILYNFVDNHDVNRLASTLRETRQLAAAYGLLFGMPGVPSVYYGSEWGAEGVKGHGTDAPLRPAFEEPVFNDLSEAIAGYAAARRESAALRYGVYETVHLNNLFFCFRRKHGDEQVLVAVNIDDQPHDVPIPHHGDLLRLETGERITASGHIRLEPFAAGFFQAR